MTIDVKYTFEMHSEISITQSKEGKEDNEFCDKIGPDLPADIWDWFLHVEPDVSQDQDQEEEEREDEQFQDL